MAPVARYVSPHDDVVLTVSFYPNFLVDRDSTCDDVVCILDNHEPIKLSFSNCCISQSADTIQSLPFGAEFRKETTQVGDVKIKGSCVATLGRGASCHGSYVRETVGKSQYLHGMCSMWRNM